MLTISKVRVILGSSIKRLPFIVLIFTISSLLDLAGISSVALFIKIALDVESNQTVLIYFSNIFSQTPIINYGGLVFFLFIAKFIFSNIVNYHINKFSEDELCRIRCTLLSKLQNTNFLEKIKNNSSHTIQEIYTVTHQFASGALLSGLKLVSEVLIVFFIATYLLLSMGYPALIVGTVFIFFLAVNELILKKHFSVYGHKLNLYNKKLLNIITEILNGHKELKIFDQDKKFIDKFSTTSIDAAKAGVYSKTLLQSQKNILELITSLSFILFLLIGYYIKLDSAELLASLSVIGFSAIKLLPSFNIISYGISQFRLSKNDIDILYARLNEPEFISKHLKSNYVLQKFNKIELQDITFAYNDTEILSSINLTINKNEFIGITGESGSGKTTLINILLGLINPKSGAILFNGENLNRIHPSIYQQQFGIVSQNIFLPNGSLANAICFENFNQHNANNLNRVIKNVNLELFMSIQKFSFNTDIGENGAFLSGGEKQRIAIARCLFFNRPILILDEPTSALDLKNQEDIRIFLESLLKFMTIIVISHDKKLLCNCTKIYEIVDKKLLQIHPSTFSHV